MGGDATAFELQHAPDETDTQRETARYHTSTTSRSTSCPVAPCSTGTCKHKLKTAHTVAPSTGYTITAASHSTTGSLAGPFFVHLAACLRCVQRIAIPRISQSLPELRQKPLELFVDKPAHTDRPPEPLVPCARLPGSAGWNREKTPIASETWTCEKLTSPDSFLLSGAHQHGEASQETSVPQARQRLLPLGKLPACCSESQKELLKSRSPHRKVRTHCSSSLLASRSCLQ